MTYLVKSRLFIFDFDFSTIIFDYLDINDLLKIAQNLDYIPLYFSKIKKEILINNLDYGKQLIYFFKCIKLTINLSSNGTISDNGLKPLVNLTALYLDYNSMITDNGLKPLVNLTTLDLSYNSTITENERKKLADRGVNK